MTGLAVLRRLSYETNAHNVLFFSLLDGDFWTGHELESKGLGPPVRRQRAWPVSRLRSNLHGLHALHSPPFIRNFSHLYTT